MHLPPCALYNSRFIFSGHFFRVRVGSSKNSIVILSKCSFALLILAELLTIECQKSMPSRRPATGGARLMAAGRNAVTCHSSNTLASLLHRNSPRTRLLASNHMMLHQRRTEARFQPQGRKPSGSTQGLSVPPAQTFGASTCVCHRPYGRRAVVRKTTTAHMNYGKPTWADGLSRSCQPKPGSG